MHCDRVNSSAVAALAALLLIFGMGAGMAADDPTGVEPVTGYVTGAEDLPLMNGLVEMMDGSMVFDKPEGRIVEARASGPMDWQQVARFYSTALPQLGWVPKTQRDRILEFERDEENLAIHLEGRDEGGTLVSFTIAPR